MSYLQIRFTVRARKSYLHSRYIQESRIYKHAFFAKHTKQKRINRSYLSQVRVGIALLHP